MHLATYVGLVDEGESTLAESFRQVAAGHAQEPMSCTSASGSRCSATATASSSPRSSRDTARTASRNPSGSTPQGLPGTRTGGVGLLRDLHDLYLLVSYLDIAWTVVGQAAKAVRDERAARRGDVVREGDLGPAVVAQDPDEGGRTAGPGRGRLTRSPGQAASARSRSSETAPDPTDAPRVPKVTPWSPPSRLATNASATGPGEWRTSSAACSVRASRSTRRRARPRRVRAQRERAGCLALVDGGVEHLVVAAGQGGLLAQGRKGGRLPVRAARRRAR